MVIFIEASIVSIVYSTHVPADFNEVKKKRIRAAVE